MLPALMVRLNQKVSTTKYIVKTWSYNTVDDSLTTDDFAVDLTNFLANIKLKKNDRISFITHSQGAIIFFLWLSQALQINKAFTAKIDFLIALAPPFWGTKIAEFGVTIKKIWEFANIGPPIPFGKKQLQELSYGSNTINRLRQLFIDQSPHSIHQFATKRLRILTLAGKAQIMNILAPFSAGKKEFEDDSAVPINSTRCGFYYTKVSGPLKKVSIESQQLVELGDYRVVEALHLSPTPQKIPGIAQITNDSIFEEHPRHPSYQTIENHILNVALPPITNDLSKCSSFLVDVQSTYPIAIKVLNIDGTELDRTKIVISNFLEPYSQGEVTHGNHYRYYFSGAILEKKATESLKEKDILIKTSSPIHGECLIEIKVKATYSSFIDIDLLPPH